MRKVSHGTVEQRGKNLWRLRITVRDNGFTSRPYRNVSCRTKTEAKDLLAAWRQELISVGSPSHQETIQATTSGSAFKRTEDVPTLEEYLEDYLRYIHDVRHLSPNTVRGYRSIARGHWIPALGVRKLDEIGFAQIEEVLINMRTGRENERRPLSAKTCRETVQFLGKALRRAVRLGYIDSNPCDLVEIDSDRKATRRKDDSQVLDLSEVARMRELLKGHPDYRFAVGVNLALDTGMRCGELCALRWADISFEKHSLHVRAALASGTAEDTYNGKGVDEKDPKSSSSERFVSLSDSTIEMLSSHRETQRHRLRYNGIGQTPETRVLCDDMGEEYSPGRFSKDFSTFRKSHGFSVTLHGLRHTHASLLLKQHVPIQYVSQRLGHEDISTTYRFYAHFLPGDDGGCAKTWQEVLHDVGNSEHETPSCAFESGEPIVPKLSQTDEGSVPKRKRSEERASDL